VDVRIIAATNQDLEAAVVAGRFRADLYYRINTVTISLPALHQRREDVPALAQHFLLKHGPRLNPSVESISTGMLRHLANRDWPGNVRELENFIERSLISAHGRVLTLGEFDGSASDNGHDEAAVGNGAGVDLASFERDHIRRVLKETRWVIGGTGGAASKLGLPPSTLRSRMKKLGIERRS
jgi:transcriptional regulator with GAF, ATPase, and Fis domain